MENNYYDMATSFAIENIDSYKNIREIPVVSLPAEEETDSDFPFIPRYSSQQKVSRNFRNKREDCSTSVYDVACYILSKIKICPVMKLHKLLYYCQAWNLVWEDKPLFTQNIEAWANGPVIRELFNIFKGMYEISYKDMTFGDENKLSPEQKNNIDEVLSVYGDKSSQWLTDQTHLEKPWQIARDGKSLYERGYSVISLDSMNEYYSSLK